MATACEVGSGSCGTSSAASCEETRCPCGSSTCGGDPIECAVSMWTCAFFQAMKEVQVETLKGKIQKAYGAKMEKAADAVLETMGAQWQAMLAQAKAKGEVREKLRGLWQ